jgi:hypothetical protein
MPSQFLTLYTDLVVEGSKNGGKKLSTAEILNFWTELLAEGLKNFDFKFKFEYQKKEFHN